MKKKLTEAGGKPNPLDHKPFNNKLAGKGAKPAKGNPLARGFDKGKTVRQSNNKLAFPRVRHGLAWRSMTDGVNLIEGIGALVKADKKRVAEGFGDGEQLPDPPAEINIEESRRAAHAARKARLQRRK